MSKSRSAGFTIVELMLALSLLGFILIFALTVLAQLVTTYNKGLTLSQINQATRQLDNDAAKGLRFAAPGTFVARPLRVGSAGDVELTDWEQATAGVFCASSVAYIWNLEADSRVVPVFTYSDSSKPVRLLRAEGNTAEAYCSKPLTNLSNPYNIMPTKIARNDKTQPITELLGSQSMVLAARAERVYDIDVSTSVDAGTGPAPGDTLTVGRVVRVYFALSTAGSFKATFRGEGVDRHLTCEVVDPVTREVKLNRNDEFCSFGEFNAIVYMRGK